MKVVQLHVRMFPFLFNLWLYVLYLTIGSCFSVRISSYDARGKFGEHDRSVRVARGAAESNFTCSFLSALKTS